MNIIKLDAHNDWGKGIGFNRFDETEKVEVICMRAQNKDYEPCLTLGIKFVEHEYAPINWIKDAKRLSTINKYAEMYGVHFE